MKGKFDKSDSNRQINANQYEAIAISASIFYFDILHECCIENIRGDLVFCAAICKYLFCQNVF